MLSQKGSIYIPANSRLTYSPVPQDFGVHMAECHTGVRDLGSVIGEVLRICNVGYLRPLLFRDARQHAMAADLAIRAVRLQIARDRRLNTWVHHQQTPSRQRTPTIRCIYVCVLEKIASLLGDFSKLLLVWLTGVNPNLIMSVSYIYPRTTISQRYSCVFHASNHPQAIRHVCSNHYPCPRTRCYRRRSPDQYRLHHGQ